MKAMLRPNVELFTVPGDAPLDVDQWDQSITVSVRRPDGLEARAFLRVRIDGNGRPCFTMTTLGHTDASDRTVTRRAVWQDFAAKHAAILEASK